MAVARIPFRTRHSVYGIATWLVKLKSVPYSFIGWLHIRLYILTSHRFVLSVVISY